MTKSNDHGPLINAMAEACAKADADYDRVAAAQKQNGMDPVTEMIAWLNAGVELNRRLASHNSIWGQREDSETTRLTIKAEVYEECLEALHALKAGKNF